MKINVNRSMKSMDSMLTPEQELERAVMACLLWENTFYEQGESIAERIAALVPQCQAEKVASMAVQARHTAHLRHAPLLLARELARHPERKLVRETLASVISRADELAEFLAIYWKEGKQPLSAQVKRGLAEAFTKFDAYQLAKYDRKGVVRLKDVLFMTHAKPKDEEQESVWKALVDGTLPAPDTWEVALSAGLDKRETFTRLIQENRLGYLALLRNLRNMEQAGVERILVEKAILSGAGKAKVLPFRFVAAMRQAKSFQCALEMAMLKSLKELSPLEGSTTVLIDVSGSMDWPLSSRGDLTRIDAAAALALMIQGIAESCRIFTFSNSLVEVKPCEGMKLIEAINGSQGHGGTYLGGSLKMLPRECLQDRLVIITDEQASDEARVLNERAYIINVAPYRNGIEYGRAVRINGFSEAVVRYIQAYEEFAA